MHTRLNAIAAVLCSALVTSTTMQAQTPPAAQTPAGDVSVTVTYTGKGVVDATNDILVFLFDTPNIGPTAQPIAPPQFVTKNGGVAVFKGIKTSPVYIAVVYDEKGTYTGQGGPPPVGTPIAIYGVTAKTPATPVVPGPKGAVRLRFDGSTRWK